ncbi:hypothetical protein B9Z19DRAFT_987688, partial [Tuber borchii]
VRSFYVTQGPLGRSESWLLAVIDGSVHGGSLVGCGGWHTAPWGTRSSSGNSRVFLRV